MKEIKFKCGAMNGEFEVTMLASDEDIAANAFYEIETKLDFIEQKFSAYYADSKVSEINDAPIGAVIEISPDFMDVLEIAAEAYEMSLGAIDVCMGEYFFKQKGDDIKSPSKLILNVDTEFLRVQKIQKGALDFGAIGKGYAVDMCVDILKNTWEIPSAIITFANSSIYAYGRRKNSENWRITLGGAKDSEMPLDNLAVGASGTAILGNHIVDVRNLNKEFAGKFRTWAICERACIADALSTAFMVLEDDEISDICKKHSVKGFVQKTPDSKIISF